MVEKYTPGAQSQSLVLVSQALDCRRVLVVLYTTQMLKDNTLPRGPKRQIYSLREGSRRDGARGDRNEQEPAHYIRPWDTHAHGRILVNTRKKAPGNSPISIDLPVSPGWLDAV